MFVRFCCIPLSRPGKYAYLWAMKLAKRHILPGILGVAVLFLIYWGIWHFIHNACGIDFAIGLFEMGTAVPLMIVLPWKNC